MSFENYTNKITQFYRRNQRMPGYKEIMAMCGFKSKNSVYKLINKMVESGLVTKDKLGRIIPKTLGGDVRLLGTITAGLPSFAEEQDLDTLNLNDFLVTDTSKAYLLTVIGDSMIDAGICQGDLVLIEKTSNAKVGEIVVARVDGDWTLKYLRQKNNGYYLEAANENYADIYPEEEMEIGGVVKGVIRKYD